MPPRCPRAERRLTLRRSFDGRYWKVCQNGRAATETGWNNSQLPTSAHFPLPPLGAWSSSRAASETRVSYDRARFDVVVDAGAAESRPPRMSTEEQVFWVTGETPEPAESQAPPVPPRPPRPPPPTADAAAIRDIMSRLELDEATAREVHESGIMNEEAPPARPPRAGTASAEDVCVICMVEPRNATIVHGDTGHVCCCLECARTLKRRGDRCGCRCSQAAVLKADSPPAGPICRSAIDSVIRQYCV